MHVKGQRPMRGPSYPNPGRNSLACYQHEGKLVCGLQTTSLVYNEEDNDNTRFVLERTPCPVPVYFHYKAHPTGIVLSSMEKTGKFWEGGFHRCCGSPSVRDVVEVSLYKVARIKSSG